MKKLAPDYRGRELPDIFTCLDGTFVKDVETWEKKRRPEILQMLRDQEYGFIPNMDDVEITYRLADTRCDETFMAGQAVRRTVEIEAVRKGIHFSFHTVIFIPAEATEAKPAPCFLMIENRGLDNGDPCRHFMSPFWPAEMIVARGYATAVVFPQDIAPDYDEGFSTCFHKLFPELKGENRPDNAWGAIAAWSWGCSRIMDYFEKDPLIDNNHVCIVGHSRGGKTALLTMAQDQRFAMGLSSCAGNSGDALSRKSAGERIDQIVGRFPYWFCKNYRQYCHNEDALPFDQHMLIALSAPRLLYTTSRTFDNWADQKGQFDGAVAASGVWKLYGVEGLESDKWPKPEHPLQKGRQGYHIKTGFHNIDEYDWDKVMDFADAHGMKA
ncbi:MAG: alpha/beta hydrolase [Spirochaetales bacterium]|nr:alpha/beta hydrolase [Spirochaetales bacterium]